MAYSLNDVYRFLRMVMRLNGITVGFGLGLLLLISSRDDLAAWGVYSGDTIWPVRMAGSLLAALGVMLLLAAQERIVSGPSMVAMSLANALSGGRAADGLSAARTGRTQPVGAGVAHRHLPHVPDRAVFPLRYVRAEYVAH